MVYRVADPFVDQEGAPRIVRGVAINSNSAKLAELAGLIGFETVWIDVEHGTVGFDQIESLCMAAEAGGCVPTVRIADRQRHHILRTVEAGARIVAVPMIRNRQEAQQIVAHGKYPPLGQRGFNSRSRGLGYGLEPLTIAFEKANARTHFLAQIESIEAVANVDAICQVEGLAGILVGPGDLSASMQRPGDFADPELVETVRQVIGRARTLGKHAGILAAPGPLLDAALAAGCDLVYGGSDLSNLAQAWQGLLTCVPCHPAS